MDHAGALAPVGVGDDEAHPLHGDEGLDPHAVGGPDPPQGDVEVEGALRAVAQEEPAGRAHQPVDLRLRRVGRMVVHHRTLPIGPVEMVVHAGLLVTHPSGSVSACTGGDHEDHPHQRLAPRPPVRAGVARGRPAGVPRPGWPTWSRSERVDLVVVAGDVYDRSLAGRGRGRPARPGPGRAAGRRSRGRAHPRQPRQRPTARLRRRPPGARRGPRLRRRPPPAGPSGRSTRRRRAGGAGGRPLPRPPSGPRRPAVRRRDPPAGHPPERAGRRPRRRARTRWPPSDRMPSIAVVHAYVSGAGTVRLRAHTRHRRCRPGRPRRPGRVRLRGPRPSPPAPADRRLRRRRLLGIAPPLLLQRGPPEVGPAARGRRVADSTEVTHRARARRPEGRHPDRDRSSDCSTDPAHERLHRPLGGGAADRRHGADPAHGAPAGPLPPRRQPPVRRPPHGGAGRLRAGGPAHRGTVGRGRRPGVPGGGPGPAARRSPSGSSCSTPWPPRRTARERP